MSNRVIKFRAWDGIRMTTSGIMFNTTTGEVETAAKMPLMQFTGLQDKNGVEIYEGDILNVFYESKEFLFDGVYAVRICESGVKLDFKRLLWESYGYNQYPIMSADVSDFGFVRLDYKNKTNQKRLCVNEDGKFNYSNYFEVIGNIYENPELLEQQS